MLHPCSPFKKVNVRCNFEVTNFNADFGCDSFGLDFKMFFCFGLPILESYILLVYTKMRTDTNDHLFPGYRNWNFTLSKEYPVIVALSSHG